MSKIFVSHASKDAPVSTAFVQQILEGALGFPHRRICHTSSPGTIPIGSDIPPFLRQELDNADLVILLLSPNFAASPFCMAELGAAWVQRKAFPLLIPPQGYNDLEGVFEVTQAAKLDVPAALDGLRDRIIEEFEFDHKSTQRWNPERKLFLEQLDELVAELPRPDRVSRQQYATLQSQFSDAQDAVEEITRELKEKDALIEKLKEAKDREEVREVLAESLDDWGKFDEMVADARELLDGLEKATREALFHKLHSGNGFTPASERRTATWQSYWEDVEAADVKNEVTIDHDRELVFANMDKLRVEKAFESLQALEEWLTHDENGASEQFLDSYVEKYARNPNLDDRDFWDAHLENGGSW
ncbi:TIR domain-containing protein [Persicimonas caeni]|uniref:TIR domain-containing protein n=1 Tax=Persicimonas caeni TaxID=2292766 RepID=A0A4Y6PUQ3_PERCE|nr:toll/interleukin-1 receptor domain-containing protein [Persicimonas caeni]QDG52074.1 TIR domain-containing protein [Persicimonas caeni]QED33295.1 TIR domain-containing protein [Persicimonas caeni]